MSVLAVFSKDRLLGMEGCLGTPNHQDGRKKRKLRVYPRTPERNPVEKGKIFLSQTGRLKKNVPAQKIQVTIREKTGEVNRRQCARRPICGPSTCRSDNKSLTGLRCKNRIRRHSRPPTSKKKTQKHFQKYDRFQPFSPV